MLSSNGRPGTRQGVRTPHSRAAMPVDAYSLAVSCGGRGVSHDIWPASHVRHAPRRASPGSGTTGFPRPTRCVAPRSIRRHAGFPGIARFRAAAGRRWYRPHPRDTADMADRALRCVDRLSCCVAAWHWVVTPSRVTPSRRTLPSRQCRAWRPIDARHSSTASPRRHQLFSYRNACRHWPGGRFGAPSLPDAVRGDAWGAMRPRLHVTTSGSDGARIDWTPNSLFQQRRVGSPASS